jgi:hypothetical protein
MTALADAAFEYAFDGWPVFPLKPGTKVPLTEHGVLDATIDIATVTAWWQRYPAANIGLACGVKFDVFDVDDARDLDPAILSAAVNLDGPMVITPGNGAHFYGAPGASGNRARFLPGCDWRGANGYVVGPPSRDDRGSWEWADGCGPTMAIPEWPAVILEALAPKAQPSRRLEGSVEVTDVGYFSVRGDKTRYVQAAVRGELDAVLSAPVGSRNHQLNVASLKLGTLVGAGLLEEQAAEIMLSEAGIGVGLEHREVAGTVRSGLRAGIANPRVVA